MPRTIAMLSLAAAGVALAAPQAVLAQRTEGDASSPVTQHARWMAPPGTFWLDSNDDREVIRYTKPRDVRICLPRPEGVGAADKGYPLTITWDSTNTAVLRPGNCLFFDAMRVSVKPASALPSGVTLTGRIDTSATM